ncbi:hypothetical protein AEQ67_12575 [Pseudomonas sp. RIT-PI-q]|uniref:hypothetical protein n=1 Tax=Pseudomonas sp. RIT-PI-q TaxID=1690247 RepID=UPI0006CCD405|nr:hypothetical protein [Pseudomonas sp. RIT-PI-q]KPG98191.1 hypothetical protein AEQ67_12575 [Pseudomonas sp. RIT-PI-q]
MSQIPLGLIALLIGVPMILIVIWLTYMVHVYTEKAEALMPNSIFVEANKKTFSHAGLLGKSVRNGFLTMVLLTPALTAKRGLVDVADVQNFPSGFKRMLVASWGLNFLFCVALIVFGSYLKAIE